VLDKTGTLTLGEPRVVEIRLADGLREDEALRLAAAVEQGSEHPLAKAVRAAAGERGLDLPDAEAFMSVPGHGATATVEGRAVAVGNARLIERERISRDGMTGVADELSAAGRTTIQVGIDGRLMAVIAIADKVRPTAAAAIADLKSLGVTPVMLSGDNRPTAEMVGDGVNDAPALAQADVGIAIGAGTDVAIETADVVLMRSDPADVPTAIRIARGTARNRRQNLWRAAGYNTLTVPLAAGVLAPIGLVIPPELGAIFMADSSIIVAVNALVLKRLKLPQVG